MNVRCECMSAIHCYVSGKRQRDLSMRSQLAGWMVEFQTWTTAATMPDVDGPITLLKSKFLDKGLSEKDLVLLTAGRDRLDRFLY